MNEETLARATFVLHRETAEDLAYLADRFGVSRSALVRDVLGEPVARMAEVARRVPKDPTGEDLRQLALAGLEMIDDLAGPALAEMKELAGRDD